MHEVAICESILRIVREIRDENGYGSVHSITLEVGALQLVVPEALDFAFDALTRGTDLESTHLIQQVVPARGQCTACGREQERESLFSPCVDCGGFAFRMISGMELNVKRLEVDADV